MSSQDRGATAPRRSPKAVGTQLAAVAVNPCTRELRYATELALYEVHLPQGTDRFHRFLWARLLLKHHDAIASLGLKGNL